LPPLQTLNCWRATLACRRLDCLTADGPLAGPACSARETRWRFSGLTQVILGCVGEMFGEAGRRARLRFEQRPELRWIRRPEYWSSPNVFLSYHHAGPATPWVERVRRELVALGRTPKAFAYDRDLAIFEPGSDWEAILLARLRDARVFLPFVDRSYVELLSKWSTAAPQPWVIRELELALLAGSLVVPLIIGDAIIPSKDSLPPGICRLARYNGIGLKDDVLSAQMQSLNRTLSKVLDGLGMIEMKLSHWAGEAGQPNPMLRENALVEIRRLEKERTEYLRSCNLLIA
jgi:hypothetical protein